MSTTRSHLRLKHEALGILGVTRFLPVVALYLAVSFGWGLRQQQAVATSTRTISTRTAHDDLDHHQVLGEAEQSNNNGAIGQVRGADRRSVDRRTRATAAVLQIHVTRGPRAFNLNSRITIMLVYRKPRSKQVPV